jgi:transposase
MLSGLIEEEEMASSLPEAAHAMFRLMLDLFAGLNGKIADLDKEIARRAREDEVSRRLMTVPGIGPISATAIAALAPPVETFARRARPGRHRSRRAQRGIRAGTRCIGLDEGRHHCDRLSLGCQ